jgi:hypothetical protein
MAKTSTASHITASAGKLKNYGTFSKGTADKTGWIKVTKTFATREAARAFKRAKNFRYGIVNMKTLTVIR